MIFCDVIITLVLGVNKKVCIESYQTIQFRFYRILGIRRYHNSLINGIVFAFSQRYF
jgi:hypothetical protein